jgi:hypothetical protein
MRPGPPGRMPKDIFPNIDIPVVSVIFNYAELAHMNSIRHETFWLFGWTFS